MDACLWCGCPERGRLWCGGANNLVMVILALLVIAIVLFIALPLLGLAAGALISTAIVGLVIGALGRLVIPGRQPIGLVATVLLGLIGAVVGSFVGHRLLGVGGFSILLEIGIAAGAVALYSGRRHRGPLGTGRRRRSLGPLR